MNQPGRRWTIASLVCAAVSLAVAPAVLGLLGVVADALAVAKGAKWWGTAAASGNAVAAVVGRYSVMIV